MKSRLISFVVAVLWTFSSQAFGDPFQMSYSGRLTDDAGRPMEGKVDLQFKLFRDNSLPGAIIPVTVPVFQDVLLRQGMFQVTLALPPADFHTAFDGSDVWVEIKDLTSNKTYPRQRFLAVPYALKVPVDDVTLNYDDDGKMQIKTANAPALNKVLKWDGTGLSWEDDVSAGAGTITNTDLQDDAVTSAKIDDDTIVNADVAASAAIATSKLSGAVTSITGHGLGTMATQNANAVAITGGSVADAALSANVSKLGSAIDLNTAEVTGTLPVSRLPLGNTASDVVVGNDARLSDSRNPTGTAGGDLTGTYPNPGIAAGAIVNNDVNAAAAIATSKLSGAVTSITGHGLGTIATQNANAVAITGGTMSGVTVSDFNSAGIDDNADAVAVTINASENVGVKATNPLSTLTIGGNVSNVTVAHVSSQSTHTNTAAESAGSIVAQEIAAPTAASAASFTGVVAEAGTGVGNAQNLTNASGLIGVRGGVIHRGTGTVTATAGVMAGSVVNSGGGTITTAYGAYIGTQSVAGVGTGYGVYQSSGSDRNVFLGNTIIGSSGTPATKLEVAGEIKVGSTAAACAAGITGSWRYNGTNNQIEQCQPLNGSYAWRAAVGVITSSLTLTVADPSLTGGNDCQLIQDKLDMLSSYLIAPSAIVTIQLPDGTYNCTGGVTVRHVHGDRITIVGNTTNQANVEIVATDASPFNILTPGLSSLNGMTITGAGTGSGNYGIVVESARTVLGTKLTIRNFDDASDHCLIVHNNSTLHVQSPGAGNYVSLTNCFTGVSVTGSSYAHMDYTVISGVGAGSGVGFNVGSASSVVANYASVSSTQHAYLVQEASSLVANQSSATTTSVGYFAVRNSTILANASTSSGYASAGVGFAASTGGYIECVSCVANGNATTGDFGFNANVGATILATNATAQNNTTGVVASHGAYIYVSGMTMTSNTTNYSPALNTTGSRLDMVGN